MAIFGLGFDVQEGEDGVRLRKGGWTSDGDLESTLNYRASLTSQ